MHTCRKCRKINKIRLLRGWFVLKTCWTLLCLTWWLTLVEEINKINVVHLFINDIGVSGGTCVMVRNWWASWRHLANLGSSWAPACTEKNDQELTVVHCTPHIDLLSDLWINSDGVDSIHFLKIDSGSGTDFTPNMKQTGGFLWEN